MLLKLSFVAFQLARSLQIIIQLRSRNGKCLSRYYCSSELVQTRTGQRDLPYRVRHEKAEIKQDAAG